MSKQNYTPGPWKCNNVFLDSEPNRYIVGENKWGGRNVADCGMSSGGEWDINEANARLIAAAPEMLEAINAVINSIDNGTPARRTTLDAIKGILINPLNKALGE